jgi:hypothetical protein
MLHPSIDAPECDPVSPSYPISRWATLPSVAQQHPLVHSLRRALSESLWDTTHGQLLGAVFSRNEPVLAPSALHYHVSNPSLPASQLDLLRYLEIKYPAEVGKVFVTHKHGWEVDSPLASFPDYTWVRPSALLRGCSHAEVHAWLRACMCHHCFVCAGTSACVYIRHV